MDFSLITIVANLEYIGAGILFLALLYWYFTNQSEEAVLLKRFGLNPAKWTIMGHDLGKSSQPYHVRGLGLIGTPDFVAKAISQKTIRVYDYKHRKFRNKLRKYEIYQVALYAMVMEVMHPSFNVEAAIRFKDQVVDVEVTPQIRNYLMGRRQEFRSLFLS